MELNKIFNSRGLDGLSRSDRERMSNYNRREFLFEKFLYARKKAETLDVTHGHILDLGDKTLKKLELNIKKETINDNEILIRNEVMRLEGEVETFKKEIRQAFQDEFDREKLSMKNSYDQLMSRIERQRDEAEEERMKELVRKMNEECELALKKQWADAEDLKKRTLEHMIEVIRKQCFDEARIDKEKAIKKALEKAEEEFKIREAEVIERTRIKCQKEADEQIRTLCETYDSSIENLLQKLKETKEKLERETDLRTKFENDFRLLQTDYKRFMNYTDHYNSDYMMKLRHIGSEILEDKEFEFKLDDKLKSLDVKNDNKKFLKRIEYYDNNNINSKK